MRVQDKQSLEGAGAATAKPVAAKPVEDQSVVRPQADKVSLPEAKHVASVVSAVRSNVGANRSVRLEELSRAIRQGTYQPDAGRLAEKIVQAAQVDARMSAMFRG
jgi:anti-sigma28 factor (negative regulator of flagellin synthesis)